MRMCRGSVKHFLLTWSGITDLRAALGVEDSDGPVLAALSTGRFTDVIILGYTDPQKPQDVDSRLRMEWLERLTAPSNAKQQVSRQAAQDAVDAFSNTRAGHELFVHWLGEMLRIRGRDVRINLIMRNLQRLNDVEGVIAAASSAIETALAEPNSKRITAFISPGTPVMAYVWALLARSNPHLEMDILANSDPRTEPEVVSISSAVPLPLIYSRDKNNHHGIEYELAIHLMGEQPIPVIFGIRQFSAKKHLILTTKEYEAQARRIGKTTGVSMTPIIIPDAFKPADTRRAIEKQVAKLPMGCRSAVNVTGGTKPMFAGALLACWERGLDPFYIEIRKHNVISLRDGSRVPFVGVSSVEDFLRAVDFEIEKPDVGQKKMAEVRRQRLSAATKVWSHRSTMVGLYRTRQFVAFNEAREREGRNGSLRDEPFTFTWARGHVSWDGAGSVDLELNGSAIEVPSLGGFQFIAGAWLEDYTYSLLCPLEDSGEIRDLRVGLRVRYPDESLSSIEATAQEFDCIFTDGKRLWIIECKAGPIRQEAIQKLENNLERYGGIAARGILVSASALGRAQAARIERSPGISVIAPEALSTAELRRVIQRV
jgi:hypothetical protein